MSAIWYPHRITESLPIGKASKTVRYRQAINISENLNTALGFCFARGTRFSEQWNAFDLSNCSIGFILFILRVKMPVYKFSKEVNYSF